MLVDEESWMDQLSSLGVAAAYLERPDHACDRQRAMFKDKTVILYSTKLYAPWENEATSLVSPVASSVSVLQAAKLAEMLSRRSIDSEELLSLATPVAMPPVKTELRSSLYAGMSASSRVPEAPAPFAESLVIRISAERYGYAASLGGLFAVHGATGAVLMGSRIQQRPVQILSSFSSSEWSDRIVAICSSIEVPADKVTENCFFHEPKGNEALVSDDREGGHRNWSETGLAYQLRSLCAPGVTLIANEVDLFRGRERDREFVYEAIGLLKRIARETGTTIVLIGVAPHHRPRRTSHTTIEPATMQADMVDVQLTMSESQYGVRVTVEHTRRPYAFEDLYLCQEHNGLLLPAGIYGSPKECAAQGLRQDASTMLPFVAAADTGTSDSLRLPRNPFGPDGAVRRLLTMPDLPDEFRSIEGQQRMAAALLEALRLRWIAFKQFNGARRGVDTMSVTTEGRARILQHADEMRSDDGLTDDDREDWYWLSQRVRSGEIDGATYERESMHILARSTCVHKFIPAISLSEADGILKSLGVVPYRP